MSYSDLTRAELIERLEIRDETARKQHFQDMAQRCHDNPEFADSYEQDAMERSPDTSDMMNW